jgi:hypothetical protein
MERAAAVVLYHFTSFFRRQSFIPVFYTVTMRLEPPAPHFVSDDGASCPYEVQAQHAE